MPATRASNSNASRLIAFGSVDTASAYNTATTFPRTTKGNAATLCGSPPSWPINKSSSELDPGAPLHGAPERTARPRSVSADNGKVMPRIDSRFVGSPASHSRQPKACSFRITNRATRSANGAAPVNSEPSTPVCVCCFSIASTPRLTAETAPDCSLAGTAPSVSFCARAACKWAATNSANGGAASDSVAELSRRRVSASLNSVCSRESCSSIARRRSPT